MVAVIAGGTGLTGRAIIQKLIADPRITTIRALARSPERLLQHPKVECLIFSDLQKAPISGDVYFCALGTTLKKAGSKTAFEAVDFQLSLEFANMGIAAGAKTFALVSALGAHPKSPFFYSRVKSRLEQAVLTLPYSKIIILRPGLLIGDRVESRRAERFFIQTWRYLEPLLPSPLAHRIGTPIDSLAQSLVDQALQ